MNEKTSNLYIDRMNRVCDFINQNLDEPFTLEQLSNIASFSKYHFNRQFSTFVGISVFKYIQLMRLKRASYRLAFNHEIKIINIAMDAQFENPESFSRAFKNTFNQTPSQFRKKPEWTTWQQKFKLPYEFSVPLSSNFKGRKTVGIDTVKTKMTKIRVIQFIEQKVAILEHRGSPDRVLESAGKFIDWRKQTGLSPVKSSQTYGVAYDDPHTTDAKDFRFDICGSISSDVLDNPQGVKTGVIPGGRCAVIRHLGSHDNMDSKIYYMYAEWLPENNEELRDFPCFFHYLNLISDVEEHELITDIYLPLK